VSAGAAADFWRVAAALARAPEADSRIAAAPKTRVMRRDKASLWRYRPTAPDAGLAPLLIVHGLVGRPGIVDLDPERSVVRALLARGVDVWRADWGAPDRNDRFLRFEDYVLDYLGGFVAAITARAGRRPALMGVCEGGVFCACLGALAPASVAGLALCVTPIDCHASPDAPLARLARSMPPQTLSAMIDALEGLPGGALGAVFQGLTPARSLEKYSLGLLATEGRPERLADFLRMERWLADRPHHPQEAAKQLVIELYHENRLARGCFMLDGRTVDLGAITAPVLSVIGLRDHLVPPPCARALAPMLRAPWRELALDAGHIGVFVSRRARGVVAAGVADWLGDQAVRAASRV